VSGLGKAAAIVSLIAGILEGLFGLFALLGMIMGGVMATGVLPNNGPDDPAVAGGMLLGIYGAFFLICLIGSVLHIGAGVQMLREKVNRSFLWAAAVGSLLPMCTFYCALTSLPAGILLLVYLLTDQDPAADPDILV